MHSSNYNSECQPVSSHSQLYVQKLNCQLCGHLWHHISLDELDTNRWMCVINIVLITVETGHTDIVACRLIFQLHILCTDPAINLTSHHSKAEAVQILCSML